MPEILPNWHPVFVHFTIALISTSTALFLAWLATGDSPRSVRLLAAARLNLWLGALAAVFTAAAGVYAMHHALGADLHLSQISTHRQAALVTLASWVILALWDAAAARRRRGPSRVFVLLVVIAMVPLAATGWLGAELVYRYGVGVLAR